MTAMPTAVADRTRRTPAAPLSAVSIGKVTSASMSVGAMPRPSTRIVTVGAVRSGRTSTGMRTVTQPPAMRNRTLMASTRGRLFSDHAMMRSITTHAPQKVAQCT
jgi:hypothetical protein